MQDSTPVTSDEAYGRLSQSLGDCAGQRPRCLANGVTLRVGCGCVWLRVAVFAF